MSYSIKESNGEFKLLLNDILMAEAIFYWDKLPLIEDGIISTVKRKQIYVTDVVSNQQGCGSLLMGFIINHFRNKKNEKAKNGYNKKTLWLKVLKTNTRAIYLYKKFDFEVDKEQHDEIYHWMFKIL